jgi:hypothetical protein
VGALLITKPTAPGEATALITGGAGLSSSQAIKFVLEKMLQRWGTCPSAVEFYFDNVMNMSKKKVEKDGVILTEFLKHYGEVAPFAKASERRPEKD